MTNRISSSSTGEIGKDWIFAGLASSIPNIDPATSKKTKLHQAASDNPPCKILSLLATDTSSSSEPPYLTPSEAQSSIGLSPQLLLFRYRHKIHAIDHACPHQNFPLSRGELYDIEDFGVVLSAGIGCPKHGWTFDLWTGESDRGAYRLGVWEVDVRKIGKGVGNGDEGEEEEEVWVRRKERKRIG